MLKKLREKSRIIRFLAEGQKTVAYPILFALLCVCSGLGTKAVYVPVFWILCATVVFAALFCDDNKVFLVPMLMIYYGLGQDHPLEYDASVTNVFATFDADGLWQICISGGVMIAAALIRFCADGTLARAFRKRGICTGGILALDAALIFGGLLSEPWVPMNLLYGLFLAMGLTVFYCLVLSMLDTSRDPISYACKVAVCNSYVVLAQFGAKAVALWQADKLVFVNRFGELALKRGMFELSWGISNLIGAVLVLGIPAAMYLARKHRFSGFSYASAVLFCVGAILVNARAAFLVGALALLLGVVLCCTGGENRKQNRLYTVLLLLAGAVSLGVIHWRIQPLGDFFGTVFELFRIGDFSDNGRLSLWKNGWEDFLSAPILGVGLTDGAYALPKLANPLYGGMYHNLFIQLLAAFGLVGVLAFLWHLRGVAELCFRRFSAQRLLLLGIPLMILGMSMADNFFFYLNFQIFYCIFLALTELSLEQTRAERLDRHKPIPSHRKPRVLFTFVEAGKGHIVPERAVCDSFRKKYGDHVQVVESQFYIETGDKELARTERLFAAAVKRQNKNGILSALCHLGNALCGDCFALYFLMTRTVSGLRSQRRAMRHMEELDADVLFTTHWSTAFYANRMKRNRPYTLCLCPDAYSNGMFNVDANAFLIPSLPGKKRAERRRMYAGGRITAIPFPIRPEAETLKGQRERLREEMGIGKEEFVVTLSDGGYGLARLEKTVAYLRKGNTPMTVIALCGTNRPLYDRLRGLPASSAVRVIPVPFTDRVLPYLAVADLFCGKSGANSMAEPAFFGVPAIITRCITYIERDIKRYYVRYMRSAMYIPNARKAAKKIIGFAKAPARLAPYREALAESKQTYGAEAVADLLWRQIESARGDRKA